MTRMMTSVHVQCELNRHHYIPFCSLNLIDIGNVDFGMCSVCALSSLTLPCLTWETLLYINFNLSFVGSNRVHLLNNKPETMNKNKNNVNHND